MNNINTIYDCFKIQVEKTSKAIAIFDKNKKLTYRELSSLIDSIASQLKSDAKKIGIIMDHSVEMIASIFAVLKVGAAYVPVEPSFPQERINFIMNEANVDYIVTQKNYKDRLKKFPLIFIEDIDFQKLSLVENKSDPNSLAYVLYTPGSTGTPKGVCIENQNVCHYIRAFQHEFKINNEDTMLQYSVCSFDIFTEEVFATLLSCSSYRKSTDLGLLAASKKFHKLQLHQFLSVFLI